MTSLEFLEGFESPEEIKEFLKLEHTEVDNQELKLLKTLWKVGKTEEKEALVNMLFRLKKKTNPLQVDLSKMQGNFRRGYGKALMFASILKTVYRSFNHITNSFYRIALRTAPQRKPRKE